MADASFDVVSKVDRQEVDNALNQTGKELSQRFDFRGTNATIAWAGEEGVTLQADGAKKISKLIRDEGPKGVQAQIQGDQLRVSGKKRDDLQAVQQLLRGADLDVALQFDNYR